MPHHVTAATKRLRNKRGEGEQLRADLIASASHLLEAVGSEEALSLRAVARQAGVAPPSIYLHFADKHELMRAVLEERFLELNELLDAAAAAADGPLAELTARCVAYCRFAEEQNGNYSVMFGAESTTKPETTFEDLPGAEVFLGLVGAVQRCLQAGVIGPVDVFVASSLIWCNLHGISTLRHTKPMFPWPPLVTMVDQMVLAHCGIPAQPATVGRARAG
jgi:AcrR family transcriptional regulator